MMQLQRRGDRWCVLRPGSDSGFDVLAVFDGVEEAREWMAGKPVKPPRPKPRITLEGPSSSKGLPKRFDGRLTYLDGWCVIRGTDVLSRHDSREAATEQLAKLQARTAARNSRDAMKARRKAAGRR